MKNLQLYEFWSQKKSKVYLEHRYHEQNHEDSGVIYIKKVGGGGAKLLSLKKF